MSDELSINSASALNIIFYIYLCISILFIFKHLKMDLMPIFQHVQDSFFKGNDKTDNELATLKETVKNKEEVITLNNGRISKLETEVEELKRLNEDLKSELKNKDKVQQEINDVIVNYECLIEKLMKEYTMVNTESELAKNHLANLELAFHDLIEKYERAKTIISGYEDNQKSFMNHLANFEGAVERIENKYTNFKTYAVEKLNEANKQLQKNDEEYAAEVIKLKSRIIQSHAKIKDLERQVSRLSIKAECNGLTNENSIFEPLVNNIS